MMNFNIHIHFMIDVTRTGHPAGFYHKFLRNLRPYLVSLRDQLWEC